MKKQIQLIAWLAQLSLVALLIVVLLFVGWFAITLVDDGISSEAMTYEHATLTEGWDAWKQARWVRALPELAIIEGVIVTLVLWLGLVLRRVIRGFRFKG